MSTANERKKAVQRMVAPIITIQRIAAEQPAHTEDTTYTPTYMGELFPEKPLLLQSLTVRAFNLHQPTRAIFNVGLDNQCTYDNVKTNIVNKDDWIRLKDTEHDFFWMGIVQKVEPHSADSSGNHMAQITVDGIESMVSRASLCYGRYYPSLSTTNWFLASTELDANFNPTNQPVLEKTTAGDSQGAVAFASSKPLQFNNLQDPSTFCTYGKVKVNLYGQVVTTPLFASGPSLPEQAADPVYRKTPKTRLWKVREVIAYLFAFHNKLPGLLVGPADIWDGSARFADALENALNKTCEPLSLEGMELSEALGKLAEVNHLVIAPYYRWDTQTEKIVCEVQVQRWGFGAINDLYLQERGETAVRHKDATDRMGSDLQTYRIVEDTSECVSFPVVLGGATYIDNTTIELMPGWDWRDMIVPSVTESVGGASYPVLDAQSPDAPLPAASLQVLFNMGLDLQLNKNNVQGFRWADRHMPYGRQYSSYGHVGRLWVANEGGNYRHLTDKINNQQMVMPNFQDIWLHVKGFSTTDARCIRNRRTQNPFVRNARDKTWEGVRQPPLLEVCWNYRKEDNARNPNITEEENKAPKYGRKWVRLDHWNDIGFSVRDDQIAIWLEMSDPVLFGQQSATVMLAQTQINKYLLPNNLRAIDHEICVAGRTKPSDAYKYLDDTYYGYGTLFWYRLMAEAFRMQNRGIEPSGAHEMSYSQIRLRVTLAVETDRRFKGVVAPFHGGTEWPTQKLYSRPNMVQTLNGNGSFNDLAQEVIQTAEVNTAQSEAQALLQQIIQVQTQIRRGGNNAEIAALTAQLDNLNTQYGEANMKLATLRSQALGVPLMIHQDDMAVLQRTTQFICRSEQPSKVIMGSAYLPDWRTDYSLGQSIRMIRGRNISLSRATPDGDFYGNIMQITYVGGPNMGADGGNDTRSTELVLSYPDLSAWVV